MKRPVQLEPGHASRATLHERLAQELEADIRARELPPGAALPSVRALARSRGVSAFTAAAVYERLVAAGRVEARRGRGYFVAGSAPAPRRRVRTREFPADSLWERRHETAPRAIEVDAGCGWLPDGWMHQEGVRGALRARARSASLPGGYGSPFGLDALRVQLVTEQRARGVTIGEEQVLTTQGATQALALVIQTLAAPGDLVVVEDPSYPPLLDLLRARGVQLASVTRGADGPDLDQLTRLLRRRRPSLLFTNTALHNPTGTTTTLPVAHRLLELAGQHDFTIVEDDLFAELAPQPTASLAALDQCRRVVLVSSFSKTIAADLRVGYAIASPPVARRLARAKTQASLASSSLSEELVLHVLTHGHYRRHLEALRRRLSLAQARAQTLFRDHGVEPAFRPTSGMFLWARLPSAEAVGKLWRIAAARGVLLAPGELFRPDGRATPFWRFNVAHCDAPALAAFLVGLRDTAPGAT